MDNNVINYYENYDEKGRLHRDNAHKIEYLTTTYYFDKLFSENSEILDACAGTGVYSFYLAQAGHRVTASDLVPFNVDSIRQHASSTQLEDVQVANVLNLSQFKDNTFDVVLCLGALYHLGEKEDQLTAVKECSRVLKKGGLLILSYINKFSAAILRLEEGLSNIDDISTMFQTDTDSIFTFTTPDDIAALAVSCNINTVHHVAADGLVYALGDKVNNADEENFDKWFKHHLLTCEEPSILGASIHGLYIGKKEL